MDRINSMIYESVKRFQWFYQGYGIHCLPLDLFMGCPTERIVELYNVNMDFFRLEEDFYIFGSKSSLDYDVFIDVKEIPPEIDKAHELCKRYEAKLEGFLIGKKINVNIGVIGKGIRSEGVLLQTFKGTCDEVNNSLFYTYDLHEQFCPKRIGEVIPRNNLFKIERVSRCILSFFSRTNYRKEIKEALRGNFDKKIKMLEKIDFLKMREFPGKKEPIEDIYKVLSFQFGQLFSLYDDREPYSYTKEGIVESYPALSNLINRKPIQETDLKILNMFLSRYIDLVKDNLLPLSRVQFN